jgi:cell division protein FtsQ
MIAVAVALALLLGCGFLWLRTSPLVKIQRVQVTGLSGPEIPQIRRALVVAAEQMTTLDLNMRQLDASVSRFPFVHSLRVSTNFPHGAVIHVDEQVPVATVSAGGQTIVVDAKGELVGSSAAATGPLPTVPLRLPPLSERLPTQGARAAVEALAAAPYELIAHIANATETAAHGVVIQLRDGPQIYFGSTLELRAKWLAAVAVLNDASSAGASYIDVSDPGRPAAGAG